MADVWTKLCGCTRWTDVEMAIDAGADAFGMIFAASPRRIAWSEAEAIAARVPASIMPVAVFVNPTPDEVDAVRSLFPRALLQFSGDESPALVTPYGDRAIKAIHVDSLGTGLAARAARFPDALLLFDSRHDVLAGGTGQSFAWKYAAPIAGTRRVVIAGGLTAENVSECLECAHPFGVDVRSGIETKGRKDSKKMRAFVRAVRESQ
jgi:phosphoribosylanthranilate isomerase